MSAAAGGSRALLRALRAALAGEGDGQSRLDQVVSLIASNMVAEVCSLYLLRADGSLELFATEGLNPSAIHSARLQQGQGLVGRIASRAESLATDDAAAEPGFVHLPETGEQDYRSFAGVPVQRAGEVHGVLVIQNRAARHYEPDEIETLETAATAIASLLESLIEGAAPLAPDGLAVDVSSRRTRPMTTDATPVSDGLAEGPVQLYEPRPVLVGPIAADTEAERQRLEAALEELRVGLDRLAKGALPEVAGEHHDILRAFRMFAHDKGWTARLLAAVESGLASEVAVEKVQSAARVRMERADDPYLRDRLHDLDDLSNRLLRILAGPGAIKEMPEGAILIARALGPGEMLELGGKIGGLALEEGSLSSHAAIIARAMNVPMVIQAGRISRDAAPGDTALLDAVEGQVHLRPEPSVRRAFRRKLASAAKAREGYRSLADQPAVSRDGIRIALKMNAGVMADLPSLRSSGAEGVGLFRTELQFLTRERLPGRDAQAALYEHIMDAAGGREVIFRTLDIGSDKLLPFMRREPEPNPALGWRAARLGLDRPRLFRMQMQSLIRGAAGRPLSVMFPMVAEEQEFFDARAMIQAEVERLSLRGHKAPETLSVGCMLETPSLAFASDRLFQETDFISVGGNDLLQFFFAADRENERVHARYDTLSFSYLDLLRHIVMRCEAHGTRLSFCGEAAGQPADALALCALGFRELSIRTISIGPVKAVIRQADLSEVASTMEKARKSGAASAREALEKRL